jgi:hypothetical protein
MVFAAPIRSDTQDAQRVEGKAETLEEGVQEQASPLSGSIVCKTDKADGRL